jgi:hypothetical protein
MKKLIILGIFIVVLAVGFFAFSGNDNVVSGQEVTMYKSPNCGCCVGHASYMETKGFEVSTIADDISMQDVKEQNNIPYGMRSCHTEIIGDYFVEGHVPIEAINKMLEESPDIDGIALPNMPAGSPGMPGIKSGEWIIYAIKDGQASEFMRV